MNTYIEPFMIETAKVLKKTTQIQRNALLKVARYNLHLLKHSDIMIDMLPNKIDDYCERGSIRSQKVYKKTIKALTNYKHVFTLSDTPYRVLCEVLFARYKYPKIPSNIHFSTAKDIIVMYGGEAIDLNMNMDIDISDVSVPLFCGNNNLFKLNDYMSHNRENIPFGLVTLINNDTYNRYISIGNIRETSKLYRSYNIPFLIDLCHFAENAYYIKTKGHSYENYSPLEIMQEIFTYADGCMINASYDCIENSVNTLVVNSDLLASHINDVVCTEIDYKKASIDILRSLEEEPLKYCVDMIYYMKKRFLQHGIKVEFPVNGTHDLYIDAEKFYSHIPKHQFPAQVLICELYLIGGIRAIEVGSLTLGDNTPRELIKISLSNRLFTIKHIDHIICTVIEVYNSRHLARGLKIIWQPNTYRHLSCTLDVL